MERDVLIGIIKKEVEEIDTKLLKLRERLRQTNDDSIVDEAEQTIRLLEEIREKIQIQYNNLRKTPNQKHSSELEKRVFVNLRSFNDAFTKAGSIFYH
jgi:hypothetical protein